jgi:hypothetical protein
MGVWYLVHFFMLVDARRQMFSMITFVVFSSFSVIAMGSAKSEDEAREKRCNQDFGLNSAST